MVIDHRTIAVLDEEPDMVAALLDAVPVERALLRRYTPEGVDRLGELRPHPFAVVLLSTWGSDAGRRTLVASLRGQPIPLLWCGPSAPPAPDAMLAVAHLRDLRRVLSGWLEARVGPLRLADRRGVEWPGGVIESGALEGLLAVAPHSLPCAARTRLAAHRALRRRGLPVRVVASGPARAHLVPVP